MVKLVKDLRHLMYSGLAFRACLLVSPCTPLVMQSVSMVPLVCISHLLTSFVSELPILGQEFV